MPITDPAVIIVNDKYAKSVELADAASSRLSEAAQAFNSSVYSPAQISVQWQSLPAPNLPPDPEPARATDDDVHGARWQAGRFLCDVGRCADRRLRHYGSDAQFRCGAHGEHRAGSYASNGA